LGASLAGEAHAANAGTNTSGVGGLYSSEAWVLESQPVYDGAGHIVGYTGQPVQVCPGPHRPCNAVEVLRSEVLKLEQVAHACPLALNPSLLIACTESRSGWRLA
jgi:hypothetical protein